jgi:hypothetical protein
MSSTATGLCRDSGTQQGPPASTAEWFADLPGGACQEPHWGYCLQGKVTMRYSDGETEVLTAGQA